VLGISRAFLDRLFLAALFLASTGPALQAMTFRIAPSLVDGKTMIVIAKGLIEDGDADRFKARLLVVTSPGGSVMAAMDLAREISARSYSVVAVEECASACAQILFPGEHEARNGLLLRRDIHGLFDAGYVTVTLDQDQGGVRYRATLLRTAWATDL